MGGGAAAVWAYDRVAALVAVDAMLRTAEATCWAWSALALTLRIVAWISSSFLASANRTRYGLGAMHEGVEECGGA